MLPDYEIKRTGRKTEKLMPFIEFALILIILQSAIALFTGAQTESAIQFRLLAHSNTATDQLVKQEIQEAIAPLIENAITISNSADEIGENLGVIEPEIIDIASSIAKDQTITLERKVALIPPKRSGLVIQPQATYDAYILTIGSGRGDNWWCSLFPNICFPDKEEEAEQEEEKVTFFLWEWIKDLFS